MFSRFAGSTAAHLSDGSQGFDHDLGMYTAEVDELKELETKQWEKGYKDDWPVEMVYPS